MRERRRAKRRAQIGEREIPAIVDASGRRNRYTAAWRNSLAGVYPVPDSTSAAVFSGTVVVHVGTRWSSRPSSRPGSRLRRATRRRSLPTGLGQVGRGQALRGLGRAAIARDVDGDAPVPGREVRHLIDPARLVHRVGMDEGDDRSLASRPLVIERSVDVPRHGVNKISRRNRASSRRISGTASRRSASARHGRSDRRRMNRARRRS